VQPSPPRIPEPVYDAERHSYPVAGKKVKYRIIAQALGARACYSSHEPPSGSGHALTAHGPDDRHSSMSRRNVIGILGGMGPAATVDFYQKIIRATPAKSDQDHLQVLIYSNPQVPDRTAAILGEGPDPLPVLVAGAELLVRGGADLITIPCVTAHYFYDALQRAIAVPILHLVGETLTAILARYPGVRRVGILATTGTLQARLFDAYFEPRGLELLRPDPEVQAAVVMESIYRVKAEGAHPALQQRLRDAAEHLLHRGAEIIVAGCTEVPLLLQDGDVSIPVVDATLVLAEAAVRAALAGELPPGTPSQRCFKDR